MRILVPMILLLLTGSVGAVQATSVKGGQSAAGSDSVLVNQRIEHLKKAARLFNQVSQKVSNAKSSSSNERYGRWLRVNSARMKEMGLRWSSRLDRSSMATREQAELNKSYHFQCDELQKQLNSEHRQFTRIASDFPQEYKRVQRAIDQLE